MARETASSDAWMDQLAAYRVKWDRAILAGSLLGLLVVGHLYIQQGRGFDRGCFGFSAPETVQATFDCSAVVSSGAGTMLGVSNVYWGAAFYAGLALLSLGRLGTGRRWRGRLNALRTAGVTIGLLYSAYLVYVQVVDLGALCALCLTSAGVATTLFGVQVASLIPSSSATDASMTSPFLKRERLVVASLLAVAVVVMGADFAYFHSLDASAPSASPAKRAQTAPAASPATAAATGDETDRTADPTDGPAACQLDPTKEPVDDWSSLVNMQDPMKGTAGADVTVIEYFDPNCPHCKDYHEAAKPVVEEYKDEVTFVYKPFPLRGTSIPEIEALYAASQEGKFFEMLEAQFARQGRAGITESDLRAIAPEIGMKADVLMTKVNQNKHRSYILSQRQKALDIGVDSTPTVLVNGHFLRSRSPDCLRQFIEEAKNGEL